MKLPFVLVFALIAPALYCEVCGPLVATTLEDCRSRTPSDTAVPCCVLDESDYCSGAFSEADCPTTTTTDPTTAAPTTQAPTTAAPTTPEPTTADPTTAAPSTAEPTSSVTTTTVEPTLAPTCICDDLVGQYCWCKDPGCDATTTASPTAAVISGKSKGGKSKKKSKGKKKKKKKGDGEAGCGDCGCNKEFGMTYMELINRGDEPVDVEYYDKAGQTLICSTTNTARGSTSECDASGFGEGDFETNTVVVVKPTGGGSDCTTEIHTSCSSSIIGTIGSIDCGVEVTKWADDTVCTNGLVICGECELAETTKFTGVQNTVGDKCFCPTPLLTARRRRLGKTAAQASLGVSSTALGCECDKGTGMLTMRLRWSGPTEASSIVFRGQKTGAFFCSFTNVAIGEEIECRADENGNAKYETNTDVVVTGATSCSGSVHTSCSKDIVGWTAEGCEYLVVTGWTDGDGDCDDGFEECPCDAFTNAFRLSAAHDMVYKSVFALVMVAFVAMMV